MTSRLRPFISAAVAIGCTLLPAVPTVAQDDLESVAIGLADGTPLPDALLREGIGPEELRAVPMPPAIAELIARLDAPEFEARERATLALHKQKLDALVLYRALIVDQPSPEQRLRLLVLLRNRIHRPRGAMGINMDPRHDIPGIEVTRLEPGLPAQRVLQVSDVITHIDGTPTLETNDLVQLVQTKEPGDVIKLVVLRLQRDDDGQPIRADDDGALQYDRLDIDFELGDARRLNNDVLRISSVTRERMNEIAFAESNYSPDVRTVRVRYPSPSRNAARP